MPPWATAPTTSYWPATTTPAPSWGSNENGVPHFRQNPDVRPGRAVPAAPDRLVATRAETTALGHDGGRPEDGIRRIAERHRFDLDQPGPEVGPRARARPAGRGAP